MSALRRMFLALYSLLFVGAGVGLILLGWDREQKLDITLGDFNLQAFIDTTDRYWAAYSLILVPFILLGGFTFVLSLTPARSVSRGTLRLRQSDGGTVEVTAIAIESLLREALQKLPEIRRASPTVKVEGGAVDFDIAVVIQPSASIAQATTLVTQTTAEVLRDQVGVTHSRRPRIRVSYDEIAARPVGVARTPQRPASAPTPDEQPRSDD